MMNEENAESIAVENCYLDYLKIFHECPIPKLWILSKPLDITFNTNGMVPQHFPFPTPIMDYIFRKLEARHLLKLYQTCKFFYDKYRLNIIENFKICENKCDEFIVGNSMTISYCNPAYEKLNNLWISESFTCYDLSNSNPDLKQYSRMSIKKLDICGPISLDEFKLLVESPFLADVSMNDRNIYNEDGEIPFTQLFDLIPNVSSLRISDPFIYPCTMNELLGIERQTKLKKLHLDGIFDHFDDEVLGFLDPKLVAQFIMKYCTYDCDYQFDFVFRRPVGFDEALESELASWKLTAHQADADDDNYMAAIKLVPEPNDAECAIDYQPVAMEDVKCIEHVSESINDECTTAEPDNNDQTAIKRVSEGSTDNDISTKITTVTEDFSTMIVSAYGTVSKLVNDPHSSALTPIPTENDVNLDLVDFSSFDD